MAPAAAARVRHVQVGREPRNPMLRESYLLHGPERLGDAELLALLIGTGAGGRSPRAIAAELLDTWRDLPTLAATAPQALARVRGVGTVRALRLHAALHLGRRAGAAELPAAVRTAADAAATLMPALQGLRHEELHALYLDRRLRPIGCRALTVGNDACTVVDGRQILRLAVELGAPSFLLAHNHPSGDPEPSPEDLQVTRTVAAGARTLGLRLVDHLVVGAGQWVSIAARDPGLLR